MITKNKWYPQVSVSQLDTLTWGYQNNRYHDGIKIAEYWYHLIPSIFDTPLKRQKRGHYSSAKCIKLKTSANGVYLHGLTYHTNIKFFDKFLVNTEKFNRYRSNFQYKEHLGAKIIGLRPISTVTVYKVVPSGVDLEGGDPQGILALGRRYVNNRYDRK